MIRIKLTESLLENQMSDCPKPLVRFTNGSIGIKYPTIEESSNILPIESAVRR